MSTKALVVWKAEKQPRRWAAKSLAVAKHLALDVPHTIAMVADEIVPIAKGAGKCAIAYHKWVTCEKVAEAAPLFEGPAKGKVIIKHHDHQSRRIVVSIIGLLIVVGGTWWMCYAHLALAGVIAILLLGFFDLLGRYDREPREAAPRRRLPLHEGMPLRTIEASILEVLAKEGIAVNNDLLQYDPDRRQYRLGLDVTDEILPKHLRTIERNIGVNENAIRLVTVGTSNEKEMIIQLGTPLAEISEPPEIPTGSLSITEPLPLGESSTGEDFSLQLAGTHVGIIGKTGAAKTKVHLRNIIYTVSACRDAVLVGIDLSGGPELAKWNRVFLKTAFTPEEADDVLDFVTDEMERRTKILKSFAANDDPDDETDEWKPELWPAMIVIIDEFSLVAEFNGMPKGTLNLLSKVEEVHRRGRKVGISIIFTTQKTGNSDMGSTVVSSQTGVWIVGPCDESHTVSVFDTAGRDAGYAPHTLIPATDKLVNDAGKAYVKAPGFGPDVVRGWKPLSGVKRWAMRREADGLPKLDDAADYEAPIVPEMLAGLDAAFKSYNPPDGRLPSEFAAKWISEHSSVSVTQPELADALRRELGNRAPITRPQRSKLLSGKNVQCYSREDVEAVLASL
jgi:hypothetical protein